MVGSNLKMNIQIFSWVNNCALNAMWLPLFVVVMLMEKAPKFSVQAFSEVLKKRLKLVFDLQELDMLNIRLANRHNFA